MTLFLFIIVGTIFEVSNTENACTFDLSVGIKSDFTTFDVARKNPSIKMNVDVMWSGEAINTFNVCMTFTACDNHIFILSTSKTYLKFLW